MTHQTSMFQKQIDAYGNESVVLARAGDKETSKAAGEAVRAKLNDKQRDFIKGLVACGGEGTAMEAAAKVGKNMNDIQTIRKRARECVRFGLVIELPPEKNRACNVTKSRIRVTVYRVKA